MNKSSFKLFTVLIITVLLTGCFNKDTEPASSAEELYNTAMGELNNKTEFPYIFTGTDYDKLFQSLRELQLRYTFSPYATLAEVRTGDAFFKQEEYRQAVIEYEEFMKRHPSHSEYEHANYYIAESYYRLRKGKDRDPDKLLKTIEWFEEYLNRYPDSPRSDEARDKIAECKNTLAKREIYIGNFYKDKDNYKAALERYRNVIEKYPDTDYNSEAAELINETEDKIKNQES